MPAPNVIDVAKSADLRFGWPKPDQAKVAQIQMKLSINCRSIVDQLSINRRSTVDQLSINQ